MIRQTLYHLTKFKPILNSSPRFNFKPFSFMSIHNLSTMQIVNIPDYTDNSQTPITKEQIEIPKLEFANKRTKLAKRKRLRRKYGKQISCRWR